MTVAPGGELDRAGRELVERLGGRWSRNGGMCLCPAHDDRNPSLSVRPGRSRLLLHCFAGRPTQAVMRALRTGGLPADAAGEGADEGRARSPKARLRSAIGLWRSAQPVHGTLAEDYLRSRRLPPDTPELRFCRRTPDGPMPLTMFRPALLAAVRDDVGLVAVHRTFLQNSRGQSAPGILRRSALGRLGSGAVRLGGAAPRMGLAEGIETALSASVLFGIPCWATLGNERFGRVSLPAEVQELLLFLDNDHGGRRAEKLARSGFPGLRIEALHPPTAGADWNDVLLGRTGRSRQALEG